MRKAPLFLMMLAWAAGAEGMNRTIRLEVKNVAVSRCKVYIAVYSSESTYKKGEPFAGFVLDADSPTLFHSIEVPEGEYVISAFQDLNNNGKLDMNFLGIPKEPIGMSNYDGVGVPGGFDRLKVSTGAGDLVVVIHLARLWAGMR